MNFSALLRSTEMQAKAAKPRLLFVNKDLLLGLLSGPPFLYCNEFGFQLHVYWPLWHTISRFSLSHFYYHVF